MSLRLSLGQERVFTGLQAGLSVGNVFTCWGKTGVGKTTILQELHREVGGVLLTMNDFLSAIRDKNPLSLEETFFELLLDALHKNEIVFLDDLHLIYNVVCDCGFTTYPRKGLLNAPLNVLATYAIHADKKLIFGLEGSIPEPIRQRAYSWGIDRFAAEDYTFLGKTFLGESLGATLDFGKIHRFAPNLGAHQLKSACHWLKSQSELTTESFIEYLRSQNMSSNVQLAEVHPVELHDLKGIDDILESLEANLILPPENDALATEMNIRPKRGVLLAGPPGTGKTTIGRALAHRLKGKFFLIDGTIISGTRNFYPQVKEIFEAAKQNAPAIIFVDDSDVIFENGSEMGLYRYLLTMLDGLESKTAGTICVMMTAMNVSSLPPALIRSGRIELWLETRLPDEAARQTLLELHVAPLLPLMGAIEVKELAEATEGMTGADLKRLIEDGKILYAFDKSRGKPLKEPTAYFLTAIETVRANKLRYEEAEAAARMKPKSPFADIGAMMGMMDFGE